MNTVIVPVDFSETSLNAAKYAAKLFSGHYSVNLILYHMNEGVYDSAMAQDKLEQLQQELVADNPLTVSTYTENGSDLFTETEKLARHRQAGLIVMGITGLSALEQVFIGSNALKMAEQKAAPVLMILPETTFRDVKNVMLASDFKDVVNSTPSAPIKNVLDLFLPRLHIVNVDSEHYIEITETYEAERKKIRAMFENYNPEFYFLRMYNVEEALKMFAEDKQIDMIINIHREHSLLHRIFLPSHTKHIAYKSTVPVLSVHE